MNKDRRGGNGLDEAALNGLDILDPSWNDKNYWARFRVRVMTRAADELFRRRLAADVSVVGVMEGWSRTLVPVAAMIAVLVGFVVLSDYRATSGPAGLEEILLADLDNPVLPTVDEAGAISVRFASGGF